MGLSTSVYTANDPNLRAKMHRDYEHVVAFGRWERTRRLCLEERFPEDILGFFREYDAQNPPPTPPPLEARHNEPCDNHMCSACHKFMSKPLPYLGKSAPTADGAVRRPKGES